MILDTVNLLYYHTIQTNFKLRVWRTGCS